MLILSIDSSGGGCGTCVWQDGSVLALLEEKMERGQDARLVPMVQEVMAKAGTDFAALDRIAVTRGPGSFTGLRIGLATARGLGLAANRPVIGIDRFSIHREQQKAFVGDLLVTIESRRLELYTRLYNSSGTAGEAAMIAPLEIASLVREKDALRIAGDARQTLANVLGPSIFLVPTESECVTCALLAERADPEKTESAPQPLYLRLPDVTLQLCGGAL